MPDIASPIPICPFCGQNYSGGGELILRGGVLSCRRCDVPLVYEHPNLFGQIPLPLRNCGRHAMPVNSDAVICPECDGVIQVERYIQGDDYVSIDRVRYHVGCTWRCEDCQDRFPDSIPTQTRCERTVCADCAEYYSSCDWCEDEYLSDYLTRRADETVCQSCADSYDAEQESQSDEEDESPSGFTAHIFNYSYKPAPIFLKTNDDPIDPPYFGVELEVSALGPNDKTNILSNTTLPRNKNFYCKHDGSVPYGFEIVSHPMTYSRWLEEPFDFMPQLEKHGYGSHDACGMHIHVSEKYVRKLTLYRLMYFFKYNSDFIYKIGNRTSTGYCTIRTDFTDARLYSLARTKSSGNRGAINASSGVKTVEFRAFKGQVSPAIIKRNIATVVGLIEWANCTKRKNLSKQSLLTFLESPKAEKILKGQAEPLSKWVFAHV